MKATNSNFRFIQIYTHSPPIETIIGSQKWPTPPSPHTSPPHTQVSCPTVICRMKQLGTTQSNHRSEDHLIGTDITRCIPNRQILHTKNEHRVFNEPQQLHTHSWILTTPPPLLLQIKRSTVNSQGRSDNFQGLLHTYVLELDNAKLAFRRPVSPGWDPRVGLRGKAVVQIFFFWGLLRMGSRCV